MEAQIALDFMPSESSQPQGFEHGRRADATEALSYEDEEVACVRERLLSEREHFRQMCRLAVMPVMATFYSSECALREEQLDQLFPSWRSKLNRQQP